MRPSKSVYFNWPSVLPVGLLVIGLLGMIPLLAYWPIKTVFDDNIYILIGYFTAYLAAVIAAFALREAVRLRLNEFLFWGGGLAVFGGLTCFRNIALSFSHWLPGYSEQPTALFGFDAAAAFLLSFYLLLGTLPYRRFSPDRTMFSVASFLLLALVSAYLLVTPITIFGSQDGPSNITRVLYGVAALMALASSILLTYRMLRLKYEASIWLISAFSLAGFVDIYALLSRGAGDAYFYAANIFSILFLSSSAFGLFVYKNQRLAINQRLSEVLRSDDEDLILGKRAYSEVIENMLDGFILTDSGNMVRYCNEKFAKMLGYEPKNVPGLHLSIFLTTEDYDKMPMELSTPDEQNGRTIEIELRGKDNQFLPVRMHIVSIPDERGRIFGTQYVVSDLSEQKRVQAEWRKLGDKKVQRLAVFRECIEHGTEGVLITDAAGQITFVNRALEDMSGYDSEQLVGQKTDILCLDPRSELIHERMWNSVKVGKMWRGEFTTRRKDGSGFVGELTVVPIDGKKTSVDNYLWIESDITQRKTLEEKLQSYAEKLTKKQGELESSRAYYGSLISGMSDILLVVDNDGQCTFINDFGKKRLAYEAAELGQNNLPIFFDDLKRLERDYGQTIEVEIKDFECLITPKEAPAILCSWYARPLFDRYKRRIGAMAVGRDITEYKNMQIELEDYAKNLEKSVEERTLELEKKLTQLGKLLEIGEEIRLNGDVDVIINKICDAVQALGWRKVVISLRDYDMQVSQPVATAGLPADEVEKVMSWRDIPFEHTDKYFKEHFRISHSYFIPHEEGFVSEKAPYSVFSDLGKTVESAWNSMDALLVPIRTKDKVLGTISVDDPVDRRRPGFDEVRDLEIFADKAAIAIENVRLFQAQKENEREAKFLADISKIFHASLNKNEVFEAVVEKGGSTIGEFCTLLLTEKNGDLLLPEATFHSDPRIVELFLKGTEEFPCKVNDGIVGAVVATGKASMMSTQSPDKRSQFSGTFLHYLEELHPITSLMVVPLIAPGKIIGVMAYGLFDGKRRYRKEELRLSQELASRAALAIENARLFEEAGEKAAELEKANKMKSEFLANVSHELRTPLNAIITLSDLMVRGLAELNEDEQKKQLGIIHRSGRNLLNLINDILDLSKIESGRMDPKYSYIPIVAVVEETIEHIRPLCIEKGLALEFQFDNKIPKEIYTDQTKLTKAIINILGNAVKFTRVGEISVRMIMPNKNRLALSISDTGIGIPADRIDEVFREFHQIDSTDSRNYGGTGLGLAITRRVLDIIGGDVTVESELGKGSTFTITLPLKSKEEVTNGKKIEEQAALPRHLAQDALDVQDDRDNLVSKKKIILVVDDELDSRYVISHYLHDLEYQVILADEGEDVLELARRYQPFAITLDIIMPDKSGWEILKELKADADTRDIPVLIATILHERSRALDSGASAYLSKPLTPEALQRELHGFVDIQRPKSSRFEILNLLGEGLRKKKRARDKKVSTAVKSTHNRILLVDDDGDTQYALRLILERAGYSVDFASEGREALKKAQDLQPNLILMDMMMPGMDGYEATRVLKAKEQFRKVPIVAMTAKAMKGDREKTILAGCDDYIAKPFVTDDILKLLQKWLTDGDGT